MDARGLFLSPAVLSRWKSAWYVLDRRMGGHSCGSDAVEGRRLSCLCREPNCCWVDRSLVPIPTFEEFVNKEARSIRRLVGTDMLRYDAGVRASSMGESIMRSAFIQVLPGRQLSTSRARHLSTVGLVLQLPFRPDVRLLLVTQPMLHPVESLGLARMDECLWAWPYCSKVWKHWVPFGKSGNTGCRSGSYVRPCSLIPSQPSGRLMYVTTTFNIKKLDVYGFRNHQRLFLHTFLTDGLCNRDGECLLRGTD
jgi:hypothetical protein